jgi:hypothetical protein
MLTSYLSWAVKRNTLPFEPTELKSALSAGPENFAGAPCQGVLVTIWLAGSALSIAKSNAATSPALC